MEAVKTAPVAKPRMPRSRSTRSPPRKHCARAAVDADYSGALARIVAFGLGKKALQAILRRKRPLRRRRAAPSGRVSRRGEAAREKAQGRPPTISGAVTLNEVERVALNARVVDG